MAETLHSCYNLSMSVTIAVDIGGTQLRVAVFPEKGIVPLQQAKIPTRGDSETAVERLIKLISSVWPTDERVRAIGMAAPGPLDPKKGIIFSAPNIPGWTNLPLKKIIEERFGLPVTLGNDANLAAVGEWKFGAGHGHHNLLYMTISTGIGGGVICDDRLVLGENGLATELGHVMIMPDGPVCGCGHKGHLEAFGSGTAISRYVLEQLQKGVPSILPIAPPPSARDVSQAAEQGDALAIEAITRAGTYIGYAMANYLHIFNPSIIILGGGVSKIGDLLINPLKATMRASILAPVYMDKLIITTAALGDDAGLLGALAVAKDL
jgi:glucokinase